MPSSPIFIVGHERSGTTLLAAALDRHSRIAISPETHFFTDIYAAEHAHLSGDPAFMVNHFFAAWRIRDLKLNPSDLLDRLGAVRPTWGNLLLEALKLYAKARGKEIVGEKTPNHWRAAAGILGLYPASWMIWVVRDGRDTIASLMNMPWKAHGDLGLHAAQWRETIEGMLGFESQFGERILRVKFEELVTNPREELHRVCQFIGVDFEARQLDASVKTGVIPNWEMAWKRRACLPPDASRIGTAARELPGESLGVLNSMLGATLGRLGYEIDARLARLPSAA